MVLESIVVCELPEPNYHNVESFSVQAFYQSY